MVAVVAVVALVTALVVVVVVAVATYHLPGKIHSGAQRLGRRPCASSRGHANTRCGHGVATERLRRQAAGGKRLCGWRSDGGSGGSFCGTDGGGAGARRGGGAAVGGVGGEREASASQSESTIDGGSSQECVGARAETFKATNTQHKQQEQAKALEQRFKKAMQLQLDSESSWLRPRARRWRRTIWSSCPGESICFA